MYAGAPEVGGVMRIAITGARGSLGRVVTAAAVARGHPVVAIDRPGTAYDDARAGAVTHVDADVTSYDELMAAVTGCDALVHLAAYTNPYGRPDHEIHNNNVVGSYNALSCATQLGIERVCVASSVNATGLAFSGRPRFDYFPIDEEHASYAEDPYSLSKWEAEAQAAGVARRNGGMPIASLRLHGLSADGPTAQRKVRECPEAGRRDLWGYTTFDAAARACLSSLTADFTGHEVFYVVAPETSADVPTLQLHREHHPGVPIVGDLSGRRSFFDSSKAEKVLGWSHDG